MSRKLKFRAWDKVAENMFIIFDANEQTEWFLPKWKDRYEVMQYTGLKDKNGKEIYEGDICRVSSEEYYSNNYFITEDDWTMTMYIDFSYGSFQLREKEDRHMAIYFIETDDMDIEIIGNIYENPELMEDDK